MKKLCPKCGETWEGTHFESDSNHFCRTKIRGTENKIQDCKCEDKTTNYHLTVCEKGMKNDDHCLNIKNFQKDLEKLINRHSKENGSNTPDWVLASYLVRCLEVFDACIELRERYYGREKLHGFVTRIENQP